MAPKKVKKEKKNKTCLACLPHNIIWNYLTNIFHQSHWQKSMHCISAWQCIIGNIAEMGSFRPIEGNWETSRKMIHLFFESAIPLLGIYSQRHSGQDVKRFPWGSPLDHWLQHQEVGTTISSGKRGLPWGAVIAHPELHIPSAMVFRGVAFGS